MDKEFRAFLESRDPKPNRRASRRPKADPSVPVEPEVAASESTSPQVLRRGNNSFGWTVGILLLVGVALASWIGSFYVFAHPEDARCYSVLQTLHKIDPLKRFEVTAAPQGRFYSARELYDVYLTSGPTQVEQRNAQLMHDYLRNYRDTKTLVPYLAGRFTTLGVYELKATDEFPAGVVAVARSVDCPQVIIQHVYSTQPANIPKVRQMLAVNPEITLAKKFDLSSVIHAEKREDGTVIFTVVPLGYGAYAFKQGISSTFRLDPPRALNLEAGLPVVKPAAMAEAEKMFAQYRKNKGLLLAKVKTPAPSEPTKKAVAYGWIAVPNATQPMPTPKTAPQPTETQPEIVNNSGTTENNNQPVAMPDVASSTPEASSSSLPVVESPQIPNEAPLVQIQPGQPSQPVTVSPTRPMPTPGAVAKVTAPQRTAALPSPAIASVPATTPPAATAQKAKLIAKTTPAPVQSQSSTLTAPTPAVGRSLARFTPAPSLTRIISAMHTPAPLPVKTQPSTYTAYAAATPVPARPVAAATPYYNTQPQPVAYATMPPARQYSTTASGVKLEPFLAPETGGQPRPPEPARTSSTWRTYSPGQMPRGKLLDWELTQELASTGVGSERYYLRGKYVVTASSDNRIVLRPQGYAGEAVQSVRVVVEFPAGSQMPVEGAAVSRGESRPFQITNVRRGNDGQLNVYAREVTSPWSTTANTAELLKSYHSQRQRLANQYYSQQ